jgi:hypothetical protein
MKQQMPNVRGFSSDQFIVQGVFEEQILEVTWLKKRIGGNTGQN